MHNVTISLEDIPLSPSGPFSERELGLLREVMEVLKELDVAAWLDQGSLLGTVRDGKLLPWDHDVDLGAWQDEITSREPELAAALFRRLAGKAKVSWGCRTIGVTPLAEGEYLPVNIGLYHRMDDQAVKWFGCPPAGMPAHRRLVQAAVAKFVKPVVVRPSSWLLRRAAGPTSTTEPNLKRWVARTVARVILGLRDRGRDTVAAPIKTSVDADFFDHLRPVLLGDVLVLAPIEAEVYLALKYGPDWRTPKRTWDYWKQDGAIVQG